jgi:hypothetical protein
LTHLFILKGDGTKGAARWCERGHSVNPYPMRILRLIRQTAPSMKNIAAE